MSSPYELAAETVPPQWWAVVFVALVVMLLMYDLDPAKEWVTLKPHLQVVLGSVTQWCGTVYLLCLIAQARGDLEVTWWANIPGAITLGLLTAYLIVRRRYRR